MNKYFTYIKHLFNNFYLIFIVIYFIVVLQNKLMIDILSNILQSLSILSIVFYIKVDKKYLIKECFK